MTGARAVLMAMGWLVAVLLPASASAQGTGALPTFQACLDEAIDRIETTLDLHRGRPLEDIEGGLWQVRDVDYCGGVGIVRCDRGPSPVACQKELRVEQDGVTSAVVATLPEPETIVADPNGWAKRLYDRTYALAFDSSAGDDCAGSGEVMTAWCDAREANRRLQNAVLAWQIARYFGAVDTAVAAGWAKTPPPLRPRPRPN